MCWSCISKLIGGPTEALSKLLHGEGVDGPCLITSTTGDCNMFGKGKEYFAIQVTCKDNSVYRIDAYGDEAAKLQSMAAMHGSPVGNPAGPIGNVESLCRHEFCHLARIKNKYYICDLHCSF